MLTIVCCGDEIVCLSLYCFTLFGIVGVIGVIMGDKLPKKLPN